MPYTEFLSWDDELLIADNPIVNQGITAEALEASLTAESINLWHPVTLWSHQLDVTLLGLNPDLHHLSAIFYHLLAGAALLYALCGIRSQSTRPQPLIPKSVSLITVALFLLHPMHVESWAWISERKDTLSAIFAFLSLGTLARWQTSRKTSLYILALTLLTLGLMSKPSLVTWPAILFLTSLWQNKTSWLKQIPSHLIFLLPAAAVALITWNLQLSRGNETLSVLETRSTFESLLTGFHNIALYFSRIFWPSNLSYSYPPLVSTPYLGAFIGLLISLTSLAASLIPWNGQAATRWAASIFLLTLIPVAGFLPSGEVNAPDRYSYLSYTGPLLLLALAWHHLVQSINPQAHLHRASAILILVIATTLSAQRALTWRNMETLTASAIETAPDNYLAHHHRALHLLKNGRKKEAEKHIHLSLAAKEGNRTLWAELGILAYEKNEPENAHRFFQKQLLHSAESENTHIGLARLYIDEELFDKAIPHLRKAQKIDPNSSQYEQAIQQCLDQLKIK